MEPRKNAWPTMQQGRGDRRAEFRIAAPLELGCSMAGIKAEVRVRNVSAGGLALWVPAPLKIRSEHEVTLTFEDLTIVSRTRVVYCFEVEGKWLVGMMLLESSVGPTFDSLVEAIAAASVRRV